jgi:NAD(P)-dependent dehydrogenase (short-subunit alcohol dehydrogenase family)
MAVSQRFAGSVALVTGAGHGIGRASAQRLGAEGARLAVNDIRSEAAAETVELLGADGIEAAAFVCDVAEPAEVEAMVEAVVQRFDRIDVLHNNAGVMVPGTALDQTLEDWDRHYAVNVRGILLVSRAVIPVMQCQGGGAIVNTASISGMLGEPNLVAYDSSKAAVINLTRQLAVEYARDGIRINCVCPGWIDTGFNDVIFEAAGMDGDAVAAMVEQLVPMKRQGVAEDVAPTVAFLASEDAAYITGEAIVVDGGLMAQ